MATPTLEILVRLKDEASKDLANMNRGIEDMGRTYKMAGAIMLGTGAAIAGVLGLTAKAAADEQASIMRLNVAMKNVGLSYEEVEKSLEDWMRAEAKKTGIDDEAQRQSLSQLIISTKDLTKAQEYLTMAMDISAGTGMDLASATTLVQRAIEGNWGMVQRYIPAVKNAKTEEEKWMVLRESFIGQAEAYGKTFQGSMERLKNTIGELAESLGKVLLPVLTPIANALSSVVEWLERLPEPVKKIGVGMASAAAGLLLFGGTIATLMWSLPKLIGFLGVIPALLGGIGTASAAVGTSSVAATVGLSGLASSLAVGIPLIGATVAGIAAAGYGIYKFTQELKAAKSESTEYADNMGNFVKGFEGVIVSVDNATTSIDNGTTAINEYVHGWENWTPVAKTATTTTKELSDAQKSLVKSLEQIYYSYEWQSYGLGMIGVTYDDIIRKAFNMGMTADQVAAKLENVASGDTLGAYLALKDVIDTTGLAFANWGTQIDSTTNSLNLAAIAVQDLTAATVQQALASVSQSTLTGIGQATTAQTGTAAQTILGDLVAAAAAAQALGTTYTPTLSAEQIATLQAAYPTAGQPGMPTLQDIINQAIGYQYGGIVPGTIGMPQLAVVHGGEQIIPAGKAGEVIINFNAPIYGMEDFKRVVSQTIKDQVQAGGYRGVIP